MSVKVKVRRVIENPKAGAPILVDFEHAGVNKNVDIRTRLVGGLYESELNSAKGDHGLGPRKRKQVVVIQGETDMTYLGASDGPLNTNVGGLRTFLAVRHKAKLKIYEAKRITVSPYIGNRAHLIVQDAKKVEEPEAKREAAGNLVKAFGSKKKRLSYERNEKNKIDSGHMNESITTATESATVSAIPLSIPDTSFVNLLPPCNRDTKDVRSVYALQDILTDEDMEGLEEMAHGWLHCSDEQIKSWKDSKNFSDYFFEMHRRLSPKKNSASSIYTAKLVIYTELLICLLKLKFGDLRKRFLPIPNEFQEWLVDKALSSFTEVNANKIRCRSEAYKDKTACYIMILVLLANDFVFDVQLMSTSLQIHINKLLTLAKAVGITTSLNPTTKEYRGFLKFPLAKPVERKGRVRKTK